MKETTAKKISNNNNNNDDDSPPGSPGAPPPPPMDFDFDENLNPFNIDLNNLENEYHATDIPIQEEKQKDIQLDTNLQEIFPDADEVLYTNEVSKIRQQYVPYSFSSRPENEPVTEPDEIPIELEFFSGGVEQVNS